MKSLVQRSLFAAALTLLTAGCPNDSPTAPSLSASGKWNATLVGPFTPSGSGVMSLTLTQSGSTVSGTGTFTDPADPPPGILTVVGSANGSSVSLTLQIQPQQFMGATIDVNKPPMQFSGTLTATTMNGALNGGGPPAVSNLAANFVKQ